MSYQKVVQYWRENAERDFEVAKGLVKLGHYAYALFFCHLALEKTLKAVYVTRHQKHAPFTHDLAALLRESGLAFTQEALKELATITQFNIQTRYPEQKSEMYQKFNNREYAEKYLTVSIKLLAWLNESLTTK